MKPLLISLTIACSIVLGGMLIAWSGIVDVAALGGPSEIEAAILHPVMRQSVRRQSDGIVAPIDLPTRAAAGSRDFAEMCATCHGAPGVPRNEIGQGLNPPPPSLANATDRWTPSQMFWIVKNGVRMTGMPAFGPTHDDDRIRAIAAFVQTLQDMTPEQYAQATSSVDPPQPYGHDHGQNGHAHDHSGGSAKQPHMHTHDNGQ